VNGEDVRKVMEKMGCGSRYWGHFASFCIVALSSFAYADEPAGNPDLPSAASAYVRDPRALKLSPQDSQLIMDSQLYGPIPYLLAGNEDQTLAGEGSETEAPGSGDAPVSGRKVHKYLGLGTLALFGLTALTAPDGGRNNTSRQNTGTHHQLGIATAAMAASTVASGLLVHWDDFHFEDGYADPDNLHVMLAGAGTLAMLYAVSVAPAHSHSGAGIAGGAAMVVAVKLTW
jgi:hypothetical protein